MRRRDLLTRATALAIGSGPLCSAPTFFPSPANGGDTPAILAAANLAGMTLAQLRADYHDRLFRQYLPFWEKGGIDRQYGGFLCELNDDGSVASDEKFIWYQGRGIWVYSFLYNEFGNDPRWLDSTRQARDFMVEHMQAGGGKWVEKVRRDGSLLEGVGPNVYGWLFAAGGLLEYHRATGRAEDLALAKQSIWAAMAAYDNPDYTDTHTTKYTGLELAPRGLRSQGHSMVTIITLCGLLKRHDDPRLRALQQQHVEAVMRKFWNPQYCITNEFLQHDYSRAPGAEGHMLTGHTVETLWIVMADASRRNDRAAFAEAAQRIRRYLEMCWDYIFDGFSDGNFHVFGTKTQPRGPQYEVKTMWAQCEAMVACLMIYEQTGAAWARQWYERVRAYALKVMPVPGHGVWRQAVDRQGKDLQRVGVSTTRKDNFHQARYMMLNLLTLDRMLARQGKAER